MKSITGLQIVLGGSTFTEGNENMEIIKHVTYVQKQQTRAQQVSYPDSLFTQSHWVTRNVEITRKHFGTLIWQHEIYVSYYFSFLYV